MRSVAVVLLLIALSTAYSAPVLVSEVTITPEKDRVQVRMGLSFHQNMTQLPVQSEVLTGVQLANASSAISQALNKITPQAKLSDLSLKLNSNRTWLNITATMSVSGVMDRQGDLLSVSMAWKSFNMSTDLRSGNLSYNAVGMRYLRPVVNFYVNASKFEARPNAEIKAVNFFVNETQSVNGETAANNAGNVTILDFRPLRAPLERWNRNYTLLNNTTTWRYDAPAVAGIFVRAQKLNKSLELFSTYSYKAEIRVSGLARANGDNLLLDVGTGQREWVMTGIVVVAIALAVVAQLFFRAKNKAAKARRR